MEIIALVVEELGVQNLFTSKTPTAFQCVVQRKYSTLTDLLSEMDGEQKGYGRTQNLDLRHWTSIRRNLRLHKHSEDSVALPTRRRKIDLGSRLPMDELTDRDALPAIPRGYGIMLVSTCRQQLWITQKLKIWPHTFRLESGLENLCKEHWECFWLPAYQFEAQIVQPP